MSLRLSGALPAAQERSSCGPGVRDRRIGGSGVCSVKFGRERRETRLLWREASGLGERICLELLSGVTPVSLTSLFLRSHLVGRGPVPRDFVSASVGLPPRH